MKQINDTVAKAARDLLAYSFEDINFKYGDLTPGEKALVEEREFNELVEWVRSDGTPTPELLRPELRVVWADEASPFTGAQVKALLEENERLRLKQVFVMTYTHRHGEDISVYGTEELATEGACNIIEEYVEDVQDVAVRAAIKVALLECAWGKALELWSGYQNEATWQAEDITIYAKEVLGG